MAANVHDFNTPLPNSIYWDASFIVNFASLNAKYYDSCQKFYFRLKEEAVPSFISTLTFDETWFILLQSKIEEDNEDKTFWQVYNKEPQSINQYLPQLQELQDKLISQPHITIVGIEPSFAYIALEKMKKFSFLPRDAYHLAIMEHYKIRDLTTTDEHFSKVPDINIFTCNPSMLK